MNSRKAGAEMWWIIIGAVIALVVVIVLLFIFNSKAFGLEKGLLSCENKGGTCEVAAANPTSPGGTATCEQACKNKNGNYAGAVFQCSDTGRPCCCLGISP